MILKHIDAQDSLGLRKCEVYEKRDTKFLRQNLKPGQTFVDVGAHIGYYTAMAAQTVGPKGRVYAFEPAPANFDCLRQNVELYGDLVRVYPHAVSSASGTSKLYLNPGNSGDHCLFKCEGRDAIEVPVVALDDVPELRGVTIDFLKIDAQGMETQILRGARWLIASSPSLVGIIEVAPAHLSLAGSSVRELLGVMGECRLLCSVPAKELINRKTHVNVHVRKAAR